MVPYGLVVRIPAFHAGGPGSIPGVGARLLFVMKDPVTIVLFVSSKIGYVSLVTYLHTL